MKNLFVFMSILFSMGLFSCSSENAVETRSFDTGNFDGIYTAQLDCNGPLTEENGLSFVVSIEEIESDTYNINVDDGDESINLTGVTLDDGIDIPYQIINEDGDQDVIEMQGSIYFSDNGELMFSFRHNANQGGWSICTDQLIER